MHRFAEIASLGYVICQHKIKENKTSINSAQEEILVYKVSQNMFMNKKRLNLIQVL